MIGLILLLLVLSILAWLGILRRWSVNEWALCLLFGALVSVVLFLDPRREPLDLLLPVILATCFTMALVGLVMWLFLWYLVPKRRHMRFLYHGAFLIFLIGIGVLFPYRAVWLSHPSPEKAQQLSSAHQDIAKSFGLQELDISILSGQFPMAHVTSFSGDSARIAISQGLHDILEPEEMKFVIAHELTHHEFKDYPIRVILAVLALVLNFLVTWLIMRRIDLTQGTRTSGENEIELFLCRTPLYLLVILLVSLGPLAYCRAQETRADLHAAQVIGNAEVGCSALEELAQTVPSRRHDPFELFSFHPCLEERMERLR